MTPFGVGRPPILVKTVALIAAALPLTSCMVVPSTAGFLHPDPLPRSGHEIAATAFGGYAAGTAVLDVPWDEAWDPVYRGPDGGAALSYAAKAGSSGLSVSVWGANLYLWGAHLGLHVPLIGSEEGVRHPLHLVLGAGFAAFGTGFFRPDVTFGLLWSPPRGRNGMFGGFRVGAGVLVAAGEPADPEYAGAVASLGGGLGYRWMIGEGDAFQLQVAPMLDLGVVADRFQVAGGGQALLGFSFDL